MVLHLPVYIGAGDMGYELARMPMDPSVKAGMALIVVGIAFPELTVQALQYGFIGAYWVPPSTRPALPKG